MSDQGVADMLAENDRHRWLLRRQPVGRQVAGAEQLEGEPGNRPRGATGAVATSAQPAPATRPRLRLIDLLESHSPPGGSAPGVDVDPFSNSYPEAEWTALVAFLCFVFIVLAVLLTVLGIHA